MRTTSPARATAFGRQLKQWRRVSGLSQLELALRADMSQRHISFIETGRSRPRSDVVHRVAEALEVPLRERNLMFEAAGLAAAYPEISLEDSAVAPFRQAIDQMLRAQDPYPAYVINRWWEVVAANAAGRRLFPEVGVGAVSAIDTFLGPGPIRDLIENWSAVGWTVLRRLRREVAQAGPDDRLSTLLQRAEDYMKDVPQSEEGLGSELVVCPRLRIGDRVIKTVSMVAKFGNVREVTLDELRVELVFPADAEADAFFKQSAHASTSPPV